MSLIYQIQAAFRNFRKPQLLVVTDLRADCQPSLRRLTSVCLLSLCVTQVLLLCGHCHPVQQAHSVGLMWLMAPEVRHMSSTISHEHPWEIMLSLYLCRDPEEMEKKEQAKLKRL